MQDKLFAGTYRLTRPLKAGLPSLLSYRAVHVPSDDPVEIRVLPYGIDEGGDGYARFHGDFRRLMSLRHHAMIPVRDAGCEAGRAFYVVEPRDGAPLSDHELFPPMAPERALALLAPLAEAIELLHEAEVVHGEIDVDTAWLDGTQENLFLAAFPMRRYFRLTNLTAQGIVDVGRVDRAPEQLHDEEPTERSDVFLFALLAAELLCGRNVVTPGYAVERPTGGIPGLGADAEELLLGSLAVDPARRPPSVRVLLDGLLEG